MSTAASTRAEATMKHGGTNEPLRLAVITAGQHIDAWLARAVAEIPSDVATICLHIDGAAPPPQRHGGRPIRQWLWNLYRRRLRRPGHAFEQLPCADLFSDVPSVTTALHTAGPLRYALPADVLAALAMNRCDVALNLSDLSIRGLDPDVAPHGLWEHRAAVTRGASLARPVAALAPVLLELCLVRVGDGDRQDTTLQRGWVSSVPQSLSATVDAACFSVIGWIARSCVETFDAGSPPSREGSPPQAHQLFDASMLPAAASSAVRTALWAVRQLFSQERWSVGIIDEPIESVFTRGELGDPRWLPNPSRRRYLADPFGLPDSDLILAECFDQLRQQGEIVALTADGSVERPSPQPVIRSDGHLSYPYVFQDDGVTYCVPETGDQRQATLYRAVAPDNTWEPVGTLVDGRTIIDPTIIRHDGRWWLFCTDGDVGPGSTLLIFHTATLDGSWEPHRHNPVKVDIRSARGAGTPFVVDGRLIRPAQDNEEGYGRAVVFNEIEELSPHAFTERTVGRIEPPLRSRHGGGVHTISSWGDRTLVDGKEKGPWPAAIVGRTMDRLRGGVGTSHHQARVTAPIGEVENSGAPYGRGPGRCL